MENLLFIMCTVSKIYNSNKFVPTHKTEIVFLGSSIYLKLPLKRKYLNRVCLVVTVCRSFII